MKNIEFVWRTFSGLNSDQVNEILFKKRATDTQGWRVAAMHQTARLLEQEIKVRVNRLHGMLLNLFGHVG